jgi:hypothetical protein
MAYTVNLGLVKAIHSGVIAPSNIKMIWYDENIGKHKYYDTLSSSWQTFTVLVKRGILTVLDGSNYSWDVDNNLLINHSLGVEDVYIIIKDNNKIANKTIPWKTIDINNSLVYLGERITGEFCVICI